MVILVTGGSGFIGSAFIKKVLDLGHQIVNVDSLAYAASGNNLSSLNGHRNYFFENIDICDGGNLARVFETHRPDKVVHLAAESHVDRSINSPAEFIYTNIIGTYTLLEASLTYWDSRNKPKAFRFHHVSTDEVYGSLPADPSILFTEQTPYAPRSPYSASKASSDHLVRAWHETYGLPVLITNCSNNYGPYQFPEKLIPVIILSALAEKPLPIYGNGNNIRDWLFVNDHVDALFQVLETGVIGRTYNIGGQNELTNLQLVKMLCSILNYLIPREDGQYEDLIEFVADRPGHDARYAIDSSLIYEELGWEPSVSIEHGLEQTVRWYIDNEAWWRPLLGKAGVGTRLGEKKYSQDN